MRMGKEFFCKWSTSHDQDDGRAFLPKACVLDIVILADSAFSGLLFNNLVVIIFC